MLRRPIPLLAILVALPALACEGALVVTPPDAGPPPLEDAIIRAPMPADAGADVGADAEAAAPDAGPADTGPRPAPDGRITRFETTILTRAEPGATGAPIALVENRAAIARDDVVTVSLPLARGRVRDLASWALADADTGEGLDTSWQPIRQWPDGSAQTVVARVRLAVGAGATRRLALVPAAEQAPTAHAAHPCVAGPLALTTDEVFSTALLGASVTDKLGVRYTIDSRALAADDEVELVHVDPFQATYRIDAYFHSDDPGALTRDGAPRDVLHALVYVRVPSALSPPVVGVDFVLGNDYLGWGNPSAGWGDGSVSATPPSEARTFFPLGHVHVREATLTLRGGIDAVSFLEAANGLTRIDDASGTTFVLDRDFFFGDHQRLMTHHRVAFACDDWDDARRDALRTELRASVEHALVGVATREAYAESDALTVVGTLDLASVPDDVAARAASELDGWPAATGDAWDSYGQSRSPNNGGGSPLMGAISTPYLRLVLSQDPRYARMLRQHAMNLSEVARVDARGIEARSPRSARCRSATRALAPGRSRRAISTATA